LVCLFFILFFPLPFTYLQASTASTDTAGTAAPHPAANTPSRDNTHPTPPHQHPTNTPLFGL